MTVEELSNRIIQGDLFSEERRYICTQNDYDFANTNIAHYGVLGMKWGVRKDRRPNRSKYFNYEPSKVLKTKNGTTISLEERLDTLVAKFLGNVSKKVRESQSKSLNFSIKDSSSKEIGDLELFKESDDSINVTWVGVKSSKRGNGYATAVMKSVIQIAEETGCKTVTLEVPGNSPDARHIYEKLGFKEVSSEYADDDDVWGGLTNMQLDLRSIKHSDLMSSNFVDRFMKILEKNINDMEDDAVSKHGVSRHISKKDLKTS